MILRRLRRSGFRASASFGFRVAALAARRPGEAIDHVLIHIALSRASGFWMPVTAVPDWRRSLHERIGISCRSEVHAEFESVWDAVRDLGPGAPSLTAVDHDADPTLAEMIWCLVRHLRPRIVVETGVSRGVTSRIILEAFARNDCGRLWSIDLPPLDRAWRDVVGSAVPPSMRARWTYVRGTSRRRLRDVAARTGPIDLFVHDSLHTPANLRFEIGTVWPHLRSGAAIVIDDAEECGAAEVLQAFTPSLLLSAASTCKRTSVAFAAKA
jgi:hypothetical protein